MLVLSWLPQMVIFIISMTNGPWYDAAYMMIHIPGFLNFLLFVYIHRTRRVGRNEPLSSTLRRRFRGKHKVAPDNKQRKDRGARQSSRKSSTPLAIVQEVPLLLLSLLPLVCKWNPHRSTARTVTFLLYSSHFILYSSTCLLCARSQKQSRALHTHTLHIPTHIRTQFTQNKIANKHPEYAYTNKRTLTHSHTHTLTCMRINK